MGGGKFLVNVYYRMVECLGVDVFYEVNVIYFEIDGDWIVVVYYICKDEMVELWFKSVIVVFGGF